MSDAGFLTRVVIRNYKSIAACGVRLRPLTFLVGPNGAGKSNFLDALRFVADGLRTSLDHALRERGGIGEVRRRSGGHPTHFGMRLEFTLPDGSAGSYAFRIGAKPNGAFEVRNEECILHPPEALSGEVRFAVTAGEVSGSVAGPAAASDRLYLVSASGQREFRPVYDALSRMGFYNPIPERIRDLQLPDAGELLARDGSNISAVLDRIGKRRPDVKTKIEGYLAKVVPGILGVDAVTIGPRGTLQFRQEAAGESPWRFFAANMSDGTLRALGALVALFQSGDAPLVGIEEPEAGLHPGAAAVLLEALIEACAARQVVVASHGLDFLDSPGVGTESILAVVAEAGNTYAGPLDSVGRETLRRRLCTAGETDRLRPDRGAQEEVSSKQLDLLVEDYPEPE